MLIDCDSCEVRGAACGDCVVTVLLGAPPEGVHLDAAERSALDVLSAAGLVPPLRLVLAEDAGWSAADVDTPIPYGLAYRETYGSAYRAAADGSMDTG